MRGLTHPFLLSLTVLVALASAPAEATDDQAAPATLAALKQEVEALAARHRIPALGIALVDAAGTTWTAGLGHADRERETPASPASLFPIASTSKLFVGLAVLRLVEDGRIGLDDRLSLLAPDLRFSNPWAATHPLRLVHLLEHTSGWDEQHYPEFARGVGPPATLADDVAFHPHSRTSRWPPGSRFAYSNIGPSVAAYVVERVTGQSFEAFVHAEFFTPLGMESTRFGRSDHSDPRDVTLYAGDHAVPRKLDYMRPSGAVLASPEDMARLLRLFIGRGAIDGERLLQERSLQRMERAESGPGAAAGLEVGYGLGNFTSAHGPWVFHGHDGGIEGAMSAFAYLPEAGRGYAIMMSTKNPSAMRDLTRLVRDFQVRDLVAPEPAPAFSDTACEHSGIEGSYVPINPRVEKLAFLIRYRGVRSLRCEQGVLVQRGLFGGRERRFVPLGGALFRPADGHLAALARVTDPLAGPVIHDVSRNAGTTRNAVLAPIPGWRAWGMTVLELTWPLVVVITLLAGIFGTLRRWLSRRPAGSRPPSRPPSRQWSLLASLSIVGVIALLKTAASDYHGHLGRATPVSVGITILTVLFAAFAIMAVAAAVRTWRDPSQPRDLYGAGCAVVHGLMAAHLASFGIIGIRFWS